MNYGLHIIKNPAGTFSYVGSVPCELGAETPATIADVMAQRSYRKAGQIVTLKFPVFKSREDAILFAAMKGYDVFEKALADELATLGLSA